MTDPLIRLGQNIRHLRIKRGLSQDNLAQALRLDKAYISRVEAGKTNLTLKSLAKIADALSVEISRLFS
jgi:transcriptional regulator with XRE-family HTH domain